MEGISRRMEAKGIKFKMIKNLPIFNKKIVRLKMAKKMMCVVVSTFIAVLCLSFFNCGEGVEEPIDMAAYRGVSDDWNVIKEDSLAGGGFVKLNHDHWLMYFLHWRPLTEEKENISVEYAKERMLNFWGPDMPFTITSEGGETTIGGHQAYYIDGSFSNGVVQTRFIVWNCPETKRQFIADCNINTRRGTSEELLKLQYDISATISCHGQPAHVDHPSLTQRYLSEKYNLSFYIPVTWRTHVYPEPEWFPDGQTETNGTLWTMLTDSDKYIDLIWSDQEKDITEELFQEFIQKFEKDTFEFEKVTYTISDFKIEAIHEKGDYLVGKGSYNYQYQYQGQKGSEHFLCRAYLRNYKNKTYFLLTSMVKKDSMWGKAVDLTPTDDTFKHYLEKEIFPYVKPFSRNVKAEL